MRLSCSSAATNQRARRRLPLWQALHRPLRRGLEHHIQPIETNKFYIYLQFLKTWGIEHAVFIVLERTADEQLALAMPGPPDRDLILLQRGMRLIAPHIQRAMRVSYGLADARLRVAGAESLLNLGHVAVLALISNLAVVSHNDKAEKLLSQGLFAVHEMRVLFSDVKAQQKISKLAVAVAPSCAAFRIAGPEGVDYAVLAMTIRPQREPVMGGWAQGATVLVSITTPHPTPLIEVDRLRAWFDLTAAEARLAAALTAGKTLKVYAEERAVSVEAARFLLKGVFRKTGAGSQAQLVTLINNAPKG